MVEPEDISGNAARHGEADRNRNQRVAYTDRHPHTFPSQAADRSVLGEPVKRRFASLSDRASELHGIMPHPAARAGATKALARLGPEPLRLAIAETI